MSREIKKIYANKEQDEGVGARVRRSIGGFEIRNFDPFLLLDEFNVTKPAGFPDHPHRGFETVTYVIQGRVKHEDFRGNKGIIGPGDLQWMTAGKGIIHSEMIDSDEACIGLQLWVNLPKQHKMTEPRYQELRHEQVPHKIENGVYVKVIAGESMGIKSPIFTLTPTLYLDFKLDKGSRFVQEVPEDWNAFIFVLKGNGVFGSGVNEVAADAHHTLVLGKGKNVAFRNDDSEQLRIILIGGKPIGEPIVQHGPFVMNTQAEIQEAINDYRKFKNGFEGADKWFNRNLE